MPVTILFVITLILVSGLIAYLGDLLGRRMGKKRLSLFGLRPRYTAIVMTTITGMVIAGLTLGTLLTISSGIRRVFMEGERLIRDNDQLVSANKTYLGRNKELHGANVRLTNESRRLTEEVRQKSIQVETFKAEVTKAVRVRNEALSNVRILKLNIAAKQHKLDSLTIASQRTDRQLKETSEDLAARKADLAARAKELANMETRLSSLTQELSNAAKQLETKKKEYEDTKADLDDATAALEANKKELLKWAGNALVGEVVIPQFQELSRKVIDSSLSPKKIRSELVALLDTGNDEAKRSKAGGIKLMYLDEKTGAVSDDQDQCLDSAADTISRSRDQSTTGVIARIRVGNNTLKGEVAPVVLDLVLNHQVFHQGESIASKRIDCKTSEGRILLAVMDLLREDVRTSAARNGILPVAGPDPEKAMQPITEDQLDRVMDLVDTIRGRAKSADYVQVRAVAKKDIYQAGPLTLDSIDFVVSEPVRSARNSGN